MAKPTKPPVIPKGVSNISGTSYAADASSELWIAISGGPNAAPAVWVAFGGVPADLAANLQQHSAGSLDTHIMLQLAHYPRRVVAA